MPTSTGASNSSHSICGQTKVISLARVCCGGCASSHFGLRAGECAARIAPPSLCRVIAQKQPVDGVQNPEKSGKVGKQLLVAGRGCGAYRLRAHPLEDLPERALPVDVPEYVFREAPRIDARRDAAEAVVENERAVVMAGDQVVQLGARHRLVKEEWHVVGISVRCFGSAAGSRVEHMHLDASAQ